MAGQLENMGNYSDNKAARMEAVQIALISRRGKMETILLSSKNEGRTKLGQDVLLHLSVAVQDGRWTLSAGGNTWLEGKKDGVPYQYRADSLTNQKLIRIRHNDEQYVVYAEEVNRDSSTFQNFRISADSEIRIGSAENCDICYENRCVSGCHAKLRYERTGWTVTDDFSTTGTFVNHYRISDPVHLELGDTIMILGLRIIIGTDFISVNNPSHAVRLNSRLRQMIRRPAARTADTEESNSTAVTLYDRPPRKRTAFEPKTIDLEGPPFPMNENGIPLLLRMGGGAVSSGRALLGGNYGMVLSSLVFPLLTQKYTEKERANYEQRRRIKYGEYLAGKRGEIRHEIEYEQSVLQKNYPDFDTVLRYPVSRRKLWDRQQTDDDFLLLRLGAGSIPMKAELKYPDEHFEMEQDILERDMYRLVQEPAVLENVPILASLTKDFVWGVSGSETEKMHFLRQMIMRISILYSYDEVKLVLLAQPEQLQKLEFAKYLPHLWDDERTMRLVASTSAEAYQLGKYLKRELGENLEAESPVRNTQYRCPYYVVFALDKRLYDSIEVLKDILRSKESCGASVVASFTNLPKECRLLIGLSSSGLQRLTYLRQPDKKDEQFSLDRFTEASAKESMKRLCNTSLKIMEKAYTLPRTLTFLEMFGVGRIEDLNVRKRWQEHNPVNSLAAPVGVGEDGTPFLLDLHQKYQGPHGLVAGMTGSGKSEFLLTYILSMAVNYHPDEVAFVLIDYKGGGLTGAFDDPEKGIHLPHLVGTIPNLDGSTIQRSLVSLQSELKRRQRVFSDVKGLADGSAIDIYKYQKMYRSGIVSEPMPHLFLISDEFAELKQQKPEFMEQLISIARIGRSLGVHLILATQKPAGVVNEQIRSNTRFRVCLKVQDRADSMDMLARPEAAELKDTGRFYLQVGYNEYFAMGQSGWSGADYIPQDEVAEHRDDSVQLVDLLGQNVAEAKPQVLKGDSLGSQIACVVRCLSDTAREAGIASRTLWKPALEKRMDMAMLNPSGGAPSLYSLCLGRIDDPENQEILPLEVDFSKCRNLLVVGEGGSGKTCLVRSVLYEMAKRCTPEQLNFYILDYSSRMMKAFSQLPHCGSVLYEEDSDRLQAFFNLLRDIVGRRKQLFSQLGIESFEAAGTMTKLPLILVVIDNIAALSGSRVGSDLNYQLQDFLKEGPAYGVCYLITASHYNEIYSRQRQELGSRICLAVKDKYEAGDILGVRPEFLPGAAPGRGLFVADERALEMQLAMFRPDVDDRYIGAALKEGIGELTEKYFGGSRAVGLPVVSDNATYAEFSRQFGPERIPLGYSKINGKPVALPLRQLTTLSVYFGDPAGREPITENFLCAAREEGMEITVVKRRENSLFDAEPFASMVSKTVPCKKEELTALWRWLAEESGGRNERIQAFLETDESENGKQSRVFRHIRENTTAIFLLVESLEEFCMELDALGRMVFTKVVNTLALRNIYILACLEPREGDGLERNGAFSSFAGGSVMLFGGNFGRQRLCELEGGETGAEVPPNVCIMKYGGGYYPLLMPCGELQKTETDPDSAGIFG